MKHSRIASRWNADLIDQNYSIWSTEPAKLDAEWRAFFEGFELAQAAIPAGKNGTATTVDDDHTTKQARAIGLISAYRSNGHTIAKINPLAKERPSIHDSLERLGLLKLTSIDAFTPATILAAWK